MSADRRKLFWFLRNSKYQTIHANDPVIRVSKTLPTRYPQRLDRRQQEPNQRVWTATSVEKSVEKINK